MAFFARQDPEPRHRGKCMKVVAQDVDRLKPKEDWYQKSESSAKQMEIADEHLFNRLLSDSDAKYRGKRTSNFEFKKPSEDDHNLFKKYGSFPPPPTKPPNVHIHDEDWYRQFLHNGEQVHREAEIDKIIQQPSSFQKNMSMNPAERMRMEAEAANPRVGPSITEKEGFQKNSKGFIGALTTKGKVDRTDGKKISHEKIGLGVLTPDPTPIEGFVGVGIGNHERLAEITPKALTPQPDYDPLGLKAQKQQAKQLWRSTSPDPVYERPDEWGTPTHIHRHNQPAMTKYLLSNNPQDHQQVPDLPPRARAHYMQPRASPHLKMINGFPGLGPMSTKDERMTGTRHLAPEAGRMTQAPHKSTVLYQAQVEAYRR